jgi:ribonuclease HI
MPWERRRYRGNKVWAETTDAGALALDERGLAKVRYKQDDDRTYSVRTSEIGPVGDAAAEAPASAAAGDAPAPRPRPRRTKTPAAPSDAPAAAEGGAPADANPAADDEAPADDDIPALAGLAIHAYTDGASSGNPGPSGIGVVLLFKEHRKEVSKYLGETTNNVAELTAILEALRLVKRRDLPVRVHTDSSYSIGVLDGSMRAKMNVALVEEVRAALRTFPDVALVKVPGHSGHVLNDKADSLARLAIRKHRPKPAP